MQRTPKTVLGLIGVAGLAVPFAASAAEWNQEAAAAVASTLAQEAQAPTLSALAAAASTAPEETAPREVPTQSTAVVQLPGAISEALGENAYEVVEAAAAAWDPAAAEAAALEREQERFALLASLEGTVNELVFTTATVAGDLQAGYGAEDTYESFHAMVGSAARLGALLKALGIERSPEAVAQFESALRTLGTLYAEEAIRLGLDFLPEVEISPAPEPE